MRSVEGVQGMQSEAMRAWEAYRVDRGRYPKKAFFREQSLWAVWVYRFGRSTQELDSGWRRLVLERLYWGLFRVVETLIGCSFSKEVEIGPGLRIHHFGGIFIHPNVKIGSGCTLRQGVTLGNRREGGPVPVVEDRVEFGAGSMVLGGVRVGRGARIGALSLVLEDVPAGATVVGSPARIVAREGLGRSL